MMTSKFLQLIERAPIPHPSVSIAQDEILTTDGPVTEVPGS